jgi:iron-sulfur cluster assembly protein
MIRLTPAAARQIRQAAGAGDGDAVSLRIAAKAGADGALEFGMGFDEPRSGDLEIAAEGITLLVAKPSQELVTDTVVDFLEVAPGDFRFVFAHAEEP